MVSMEKHETEEEKKSEKSGPEGFCVFCVHDLYILCAGACYCLFGIWIIFHLHCCAAKRKHKRVRRILPFFFAFSIYFL